MLSPDMILEDVLYGEDLEAKKEYYKAYWVYMYAESAVEREDEAMCLIGSKEHFAEAEDVAGTHRIRVWNYLTEEEKESARRGINPCSKIPELIDLPTSLTPYDLGDYYVGYADEDSERENRKKDPRAARKESFRATLLLILICIFHPSIIMKFRKK